MTAIPLDRTITVVSVIAGGRDEGRDSLAPASRGSARAPDPARSGASTPGSTDVGSKMQPSPPTSPSSTTMGAPAASASPAVAAARFRASLAGEPSPAGERTACVLAGYRRTASTPFEPWLTDSPGRAAPLAPLLGPTGRARSAADTGGRAVRPGRRKRALRRSTSSSGSSSPARRALPSLSRGQPWSNTSPAAPVGSRAPAAEAVPRPCESAVPDARWCQNRRTVAARGRGTDPGVRGGGPGRSSSGVLSAGLRRVPAGNAGLSTKVVDPSPRPAAGRFVGDATVYGPPPSNLTSTSVKYLQRDKRSRTSQHRWRRAAARLRC